MEKLIYRERHGSNCVKWDILERKYGNSKLQSMWIADMDFATPKCVRDALKEYSEFGVYGYYLAPSENSEAYLNWQERRHGFRPEPNWLRFAAGGVTGIALAVEAFTKPGEKVACMIPAYPPFVNVPEKLGRRTVTCPLAYTNGIWSVNMQAAEELFAKEQPKMLIWCSPHNPTGRVWMENELQQLLKLCRKYNVLILSDEIHQDLCQKGFKHIPLYSFREYQDIIICMNSPAKTFNLAACNSTTMIIPDEGLRTKWDEANLMAGEPRPTAFAQIAYEAAYSGGAEWLGSVLTQVEQNYRIFKETVAAAAPEIKISSLEGTYLLWIDFTGIIPADDMRTFIQDECGLALNYGNEFGGDDYACFVRLNLATSEENVSRAAENIAASLRRRRS